LIGALGVALGGAAVDARADEPQESRRMLRAKDLIMDEQWQRAIVELRAASTDPKERNKDEALYWLAAGQNQVGDLAAAVETIRTLEREYPKSRWLHPGRSLLIELAQKLRRDDFLWWSATPRPTHVEPFPAGPVRDAEVVTPAPPSRAPTPAARPPRATTRRTPPPAKQGETPPAPPVPREAPTTWGGMFYYVPDTDLRIQALSTLIHSDPDKSITLLKNIALDDENTAAARRAVFVLAHSRMPKAQSAVVELATHGAEPVQIAAVRELGRFGDPTVSNTLLKVYRTAKEPVKREVVVTLGRRSEIEALVGIVDSERDVELREAVVTSLGRAGGREPLARLYFRDKGPLKQPIIASLFSCRGEDELIRIAEEEKNPRLKSEAMRRLTLMGTPKAKAYVEKTRAKTGR
jgi:hypothetical protein